MIVCQDLNLDRARLRNVYQQNNDNGMEGSSHEQKSEKSRTRIGKNENVQLPIAQQRNGPKMSNAERNEHC